MRRHGPAGPGVLLALVLTLALPAPAPAAPAATDRRVHPADVSGLPSYVQRVAPSIVALKVRNAEGAASSLRLGSRRSGSGVIFDARGYVLTVSYLLLDAVAIEAQGYRGRTVGARLVGLDLDTRLGVIKLEDPGPWPVATLGRSEEAVAGMRTGTVGVNGVAVQSREDFYLELWSRRAGDLIEMAVQRADRVRVITVPSIDRHTLYRPREP